MAIISSLIISAPTVLGKQWKVHNIHRPARHPVQLSVFLRGSGKVHDGGASLLFQCEKVPQTRGQGTGCRRQSVSSTRAGALSACALLSGVVPGTQQVLNKH